MTDRIQAIILECLQEIAQDHRIDGLSGNIDPDTRLYGQKSLLDSMALVSLIADIEGKISEEFDVDLILADERAMDQRLTPFARVSTLTTYIETLLNRSSPHEPN
jgi:acyl carrier protein